MLYAVFLEINCITRIISMILLPSIFQEAMKFLSKKAFHPQAMFHCKHQKSVQNNSTVTGGTSAACSRLHRGNITQYEYPFTLRFWFLVLACVLNTTWASDSIPCASTLFQVHTISVGYIENPNSYCIKCSSVFANCEIDLLYRRLMRALTL